MGFNTGLMVLNDSMSLLRDDPDAGTKLFDLVREACTARRGEVLGCSMYAKNSRGGSMSATVAYALPSLHADEMQVIAIGGNRIQYLGYGGGYAATPDQMLQQLADQMGYRLVKKPERKIAHG